MHAGYRDEAVSETRVELHMGRGRNAYKWIIGPYARRERLATGIRLKTISQELSVALVDILEAADRRGQHR